MTGRGPHDRNRRGDGSVPVREKRPARGARRVTATVFAAQGAAVAAVSTTVPAAESRLGLSALAMTTLTVALTPAAGAGSFVGLAAVRRSGPVPAMRAAMLTAAAVLLCGTLLPVFWSSGPTAPGPRRAWRSRRLPCNSRDACRPVADEVLAAVRDERPWILGARRMGPVAAEDDPVLPEAGDGEPDDGRVVSETADAEAAHGRAGGLGQIGDPGRWVPAPRCRGPPVRRR
ncbi:hypothetical protein [Streptomyces sp. YKOK-I1]